MDFIDKLNRHFNQETELEYAHGPHAAVYGLVAGRLQTLKKDQPMVLEVGHCDPAGIPVVINASEGYSKYLVVVLPLED